MRTASILLFVVVTGTGGEICLTHAMKLLGEVHDFHPRAILSFVLRALRVSWLWIGALLMFFVAYMVVLTHMAGKGTDGGGSRESAAAAMPLPRAAE